MEHEAGFYDTPEQVAKENKLLKNWHKSVVRQVNQAIKARQELFRKRREARLDVPD